MSTKFIFKESGLLQWKNSEGAFIDVNIIDSFPLSNPGKYLSVVNESGEEVDYVEDVNHLNESDRVALQKAIASKNFHFEIKEVLNVEEQQELRCYYVATVQGERKIFTKLDEWPSLMGDGSIKFEDLFGDIYIIRNKESLSEKSRKTLSYYIE